eukprot:1161781-Pelagomonas_calceolata.AAC.12
MHGPQCGTLHPFCCWGRQHLPCISFSQKTLVLACQWGVIGNLVGLGCAGNVMLSGVARYLNEHRNPQPTHRRAGTHSLTKNAEVEGVRKDVGMWDRAGLCPLKRVEDMTQGCEQIDVGIMDRDFYQRELRI